MSTDSTRPMSRDASRILAENFTKGLESTSKLLHELQGEVRNGNISITELKFEISRAKTDLEILSRLVRGDGLGEKSMADKITVIEYKMEMIDNWISQKEKEQSEAKNINTKGKWQVKIALVAGSIGLLGTIIQAIITLLGG